jgi:glycosyltransferase involved in cell wall biosynthesis
MSPRRVLVVLHEDELGGASRAVLRCVPGLEERGWQFVYWVPRPSPLFDHLESGGAEVYGRPRPIAYSLAALRLPPGAIRRLAATPGYIAAFTRLIGRLQPDLVHANSHTTLADLCLANTRGVPSIFHVHEMFGDGAKWNAGRRLAFWAADEVVAVSAACAARLDHGDRRARVVRNGVPVPPAPRPREARDGGLTVGTVGVISRRKGTDVFVEAARIARETDPSLRFELVGAPTDPLDAEWARGVLADAARAGIVHLERADVAAKLNEWDLFVLPSRRDPFPLSSLEAMAHGLPVIGTAVDGIPEQVSERSGVLVDPEDPAALARAITTLAARSLDDRAALGSAGRERVLAEFTIERQVAELESVYRAALESHA